MDQENQILPLSSTWLFFIVVVTVAGCTTPTPYKSIDRFRGGYHERQVGPTEWLVVFEHNSKLLSERAKDYCLLWASEICLDNGFTHFVLLDEQADVIRKRRLISDNTKMGVDGPIVRNTHSVVEEIEIYEIHIACSYAKEANSLSAKDLYESIRTQYNIKK